MSSEESDGPQLVLKKPQRDDNKRLKEDEESRDTILNEILKGDPTKHEEKIVLPDVADDDEVLAALEMAILEASDDGAVPATELIPERFRPVRYELPEPTGDDRYLSHDNRRDGINEHISHRDDKKSSRRYTSRSPVRSSRDRGSNGHSYRDSRDREYRDRGRRDRGRRDRGSRDRGSRDRGSRDRVSRERDSTDRVSRERGSTDRVSRERDSTDRVSRERGSTDRDREISTGRGSSDRRSSETVIKTEAESAADAAKLCKRKAL